MTQTTIKEQKELLETTGVPSVKLDRMDTSSANLGSTRPKRLRKWLLRGFVAFALVMLASATFLKVSFDRVEAKAELVNRTGVSLNQFFKEFSKSLKTQDQNASLQLFASPGASVPKIVKHQLQQRDNVQSFQWKTDGTGSIVQQLNMLTSEFQSFEFVKTKIMSMRDISDNGATANALVWLRGSTGNENIETKVQFEFDLKAVDGHWLINDLNLRAGRTVTGNGSGFTDITKTAGIEFESTHNPLLQQPEWYPETFGIMRYASAGVSVCDYDSDGNQDIFFCDGTNPTLYRGKGDGTFQDVMEETNLPRAIKAVHVALFVDLDNDGDQDLFLGRGTGMNYLFENTGNGSFIDVTSKANVGGLWVATAAALDYDNDGLTDLFLGRYLDPRTELPDTNFYTRNGEGASLLRNTGGLVFEDVTQRAGINETGLNLGVAAADWDLDGDQDVYVANDFGRNAMLLNNGDGTFTDASKATGTEDIGYGMSAGFGDVNRDGLLDLYVASVHSGQRWFGNSATLQRYLLTSIQERTIFEDYPLYREIYEYVDGDWAEFGEKVIRGNSLMLNRGDGTFENVTERCQTNPHGWYWSSAIFDFDNDMQQDIYTVNGWVTGKYKEDL